MWHIHKVTQGNKAKQTVEGEGEGSDWEIPNIKPSIFSLMQVFIYVVGAQYLHKAT